ncbi:unnamed protein product [Cuscuta campestris]|uniref:Uncharacterized protein n=1 Tax=Cuscuta campestris TaxID=132261 RepID=A0A484MM39_9ASTE|nr:unnamed protein product [Cuscuta campestris]
MKGLEFYYKRFKPTPPIEVTQTRSPIEELQPQPPIGEARTRSPIDELQSQPPIEEAQTRSPIEELQPQAQFQETLNEFDTSNLEADPGKRVPIHSMTKNPDERESIRRRA